MKLNVTKTVLVALVSAVALGSIAPAFAQSSTRTCRRVVNVEGGPDQPRAIAGLDYNQIPGYANASDIYGGSRPITVIQVGERVNLAQPMSTQFVNDPNDQNGMGTQMIAIENPRNANSPYLWIPLVDMGLAGGRGSTTYTAVGKANLGHCAVRGMW